MLKDVSFGQYYPGNSFVHKMDPRVKMLLLIAYIVLVFVVKNFYGFIVVGAFLIFAVIISGLPFGKVLKSIKAVFFVVILTFILNILFYRPKTEPTVLFWKISKESLVFASFMAVRIITLVLGSMLLSLTTTPVALTDGIESLMSPLKLVKFPVRELALVMSIALRFIPILTGEAEKIMMAQKARGADLESGNVFKRAKAMIPVLVPLLVSAFRRAEELGDAMDSRCYNAGGKRTKYKKLKAGWRDVLGTVVVAACIAGVILLNIYAGALV